MKSETKIIKWEQEIFTPQNSISSKRVESVNDRVSYIVPRDGWYSIFVLNVHAASEKKVTLQKTVL